MLINYGSNLNACEKSDLQTPLFVGVINDYKDAVNLLIKSGNFAATVKSMFIEISSLEIKKNWNHVWNQVAMST